MVATFKKRVFAVLPLIIVGLYFSVIYQPAFYFVNPNLPTTNQPYKTFCYSDSVHEGKSKIQLIENKSNKFSYRYILKEGYKYKFADATFAANDNSYFDMSSYDYVTIKIRASKGTRIQLGFSSFIDHYTNVKNGISYRISLFNLNVGKDYKEINAPLKAFYTPDWWYTENNKKESDFSAPNFAKIQEITFSNCINLKNNIEDFVEIEQFSFHINYLKHLGIISLFLISYYLIYYLILWKKNKVGKTEINFIYDNSAANTYLNAEEESIFNYLTNHYFHQELSIIDLQNATNIPERKLSTIIKNKTGLNFKQFLNNLRLVEAKRLLKESDLQISEIAFKVGYGNASHFNRVFEASENCSPNDYRKENH